MRPTGCADQCPQLGVERTQRGRRLWAVHDPKPTCWNRFGDAGIDSFSLSATKANLASAGFRSI
jgi:hypothetical protein